MTRSPFIPFFLLLLLSCGDSAGPGTGKPPIEPPRQPRPASLSVASGDSQAVAPGEALPVAPRVVVRSDSGGLMAGVLVRFSVESGGGVVEGDSVRTGADGVAQPLSWRLGPLPGLNVLRARVESLPPIELSATARLLVPSTTVSGVVTLPSGTQLNVGTLRVASELSDVAVADDGSFTALADPTATLMAGVEAPNGSMILLGWIGDGGASFSARTTAEVMTFFDLGGFMARTAEHEKLVRDFLKAEGRLAPLVSAIEEVLRSAPNDVTLSQSSIVAARRSVVAQLEALRPPSTTAASVTVSPLQIKSGIAVDPVGFNALTITNSLRRRTVAFVDQVSFVPPGGGNPQSSVIRGSPLQLTAVTPITSLFATAIDVIFGNYAGTPVISPPQEVRLNPLNAQTTTYRVTVVGPGGTQSGSHAPLTTEQDSAMVRASIETILLDIVLPFIDQAINLNSLTQVPGATAPSNFVTKFIDLNPAPVVLALENLDFTGALSETLKLLFDTGAGQQMLHEVFFVPRAAELGKLELLKIDTKLIKRQRALAWVELIATTIATASAFHDVAIARAVEQWDVDVTPARIRLNPPASTISNLEIMTLSAVNLDATGGGPIPTFSYHWSTTGQHGKICAARSDQGTNYCGAAFKSSLDVVSFDPDVTSEGTDDVTVQVYVVEHGRETFVGEATAQVTTFATKVSLLPQNVSIQPNTSTTLNAKIEPQPVTGTVSYIWTTSGNFGGLGSSGTSSSATYSAGSAEGTDRVTVEGFVTVNGMTRSIGRASGDVEVKKTRPTTVIGSWYVSTPVALPQGRSCIVLQVKFPLVEGATQYDIWLHGYNDEATGTVEFRDTFFPPFEAWTPCSNTGSGSNGVAGSDFLLGRAGFHGPANAIANAISNFNSRFAGMVVEVTVKY